MNRIPRRRRYTSGARADLTWAASSLCYLTKVDKTILPILYRRRGNTVPIGPSQSRPEQETDQLRWILVTGRSARAERWMAVSWRVAIQPHALSATQQQQQQQQGSKDDAAV